MNKDITKEKIINITSAKVEDTNKKSNDSILNINKNIDLDNWISGSLNEEVSFSIHKKGHLVFYIEQSEK
jgi:hypothetical protein